MQLFRAAVLLVALPAAAHAGEVVLQTTPLLTSPFYDRARVEKEVIERIHTGVYDGYQAELCVDDPARCDAAVFKPYKVESGYILKIQKGTWNSLPAEVKDAAVREIVYYTWGHPKRTYSPVDVVIKGDPLGASPLSYLSPKSAERYLRFARSEWLLGGAGGDAYGPNCWFSAISAIADGRSTYARAQMLAPAVWEKPRFMGPTEFRLHLRQFTQVSEPQFGDIIRYYTDQPIYGGFQDLVFGGEVHAAVYVGKETYAAKNGQSGVREFALTKNGRSDLDFLIFQDVRGLDETYLSPLGATPAVPEDQKIKKGYFRVKRGVSLLDPVESGKLSGAHGGYLVDNKNYADRWLCLAKLIGPPAGEGKNCYSYPAEWMTLPSADLVPASAEAQPLKMQHAPRLRPFGPPLRRDVTKTSG